MTVQARPEPEPLPGTPPTVHELLLSVQHVEHTHAQLLAELHTFLAERAVPAQLRGPYTLTAANPTQRDDAGQESPSIGIYNPGPAKVFTGIGGAIARANAPLYVPAQSMLVLPISIGDLDLGVDPADPALVGGVACVVTVIRFESVQAASLGSLK